MRRVLFIVSLMLALQAEKAVAAIQTYAVSGNFAIDGNPAGTLSGLFNYEDQSETYSNISILVSGYNAFSNLLTHLQI